jgi:hypothetical protein
MYWSGISPLCLEGAVVLSLLSKRIVIGDRSTTSKKATAVASPALKVTYLNKRKGPKKSLKLLKKYNTFYSYEF